MTRVLSCTLLSWPVTQNRTWSDLTLAWEEAKINHQLLHCNALTLLRFRILFCDLWYFSVAFRLPLSDFEDKVLTVRTIITLDPDLWFHWGRPAEVSLSTSKLQTDLIWRSSAEPIKSMSSCDGFTGVDQKWPGGKIQFWKIAFL